MNVPNHIAIILDGNGRWAKAKGMPRSYGHVKGCANLETVCDYMKELGVKYVTVYAFSTENWKRSKDEVDGLMKLFRSYLKKCIKLADKNKMRVRVIGEVSAFDQDIQESIARLEQYSQKYDEIYFQIALNYGSRDEIIRGIRKLAQDAADGKVKPEEIDEHVFDNYLDTAGIPDPDLMIRTSGELRLSNFLLWQMAYTEFYFTDVAWPDFNKAELIKAIALEMNSDKEEIQYESIKDEESDVGAVRDVYYKMVQSWYVSSEFEEYTTNTYSKGASAWKNWAEKIESGEMEGKDAIVAFYEKQLAEAKLEVMALEQRLEAIKNDEPAIFPVTAEEIEDINDAYVEYFGDKYGKQTDNHRYADVYIGQMLWAFLTQENF